jgi:hypothetical protein
MKPKSKFEVNNYMEKMVLEIRTYKKLKRWTGFAGWFFMLLGICLFLMAYSIEIVPFWISALSFILGITGLVVVGWLKSQKKVGKIIIKSDKIVFKFGVEKTTFNFSNISKVKLILASEAEEFHRDWWPAIEGKPAYEASSENFIHIKPAKGKPVQTTFFLPNKTLESRLINLLEKHARKGKMELKIG